jgi:allantoinase
MKTNDTWVIRNVSLLGGPPVDVSVAGESIDAIGSNLTGTFDQEIDGTGKILLPGVVDSHVHFNEPGRSDWEGIATGSAALAAGGGTVFFDMPLNSTPPVLTAEAVRAKRRLAEQKSCVDFAIWGGLTPDSLDHLEAMAAEGVIGFKAFMSDSGLAEFGKAEAETLRRGMKIAERLGLPVAVHAEDDSVIAEHLLNHPRKGPGSMRDWLESRPIEAELSAIRLALDLAGETGADLHIVHVTSATGLRLVAEARAGGVTATAETCPHYLLLDQAAAEKIGQDSKCAPPIRPRKTVDGLWDALRHGLIDTIGSDHSPAPPSMKTGEDVFAMWGGISGCQHGIELLCNEAPLFKQPMEQLSDLWSEAPARRFRLHHSIGKIRIGGRADFFLLEKQPNVISRGELLYQHAQSAYLGRQRDWRITNTWLRGLPVDSTTRGKFLTPQTP